MQKGMIGFLNWVLIAALGCASSHGPGPDGETHFLMRCEQKCDQGLDCVCGICTQICESNDECSRYPGDPSCVAPERLEAARACHSFDPSHESVCDVTCESDNDCEALGKEYSCQSGFCRGEKVYDDIVARTGENSRTNSNDIAQDAASDFQIPELIQVLDASTSPVNENRWIGGLSAGARAPAPGEAPANFYGEPSVPTAINEPTTLECRYYSDMGVDFNVTGYESLQNCIEYSYCSKSCDQNSDCEDGGSGDAVPICNDKKECMLSCDEQTTCPDGMVCYSPYGNRKACFWGVDMALPGCPAYCEIDPVPKGCPGYCAAAGVGCDPETEVYCCDGLTCGPGGWCVVMQ